MQQNIIWSNSTVTIIVHNKRVLLSTQHVHFRIVTYSCMVAYSMYQKITWIECCLLVGIALYGESMTIY